MINKNQYQKMSQNELNKEFLDACKNGGVEIVKYLLSSPDLEKNADIKIKDHYGQNALNYACFSGHLEIVKYLLNSPELKEHADIHHKNNNGNNALMYACSYGKREIVKYLLNSPDLKEYANINDKNQYDYNVLMFACEYGHLDISQYLIIDMNVEVDSETINWLEGGNKDKKIYNDTLKMIEIRNLHQKLDSTINIDKINNKKVKV